MKKLRITVEGKVYEVTVEVLEDTDIWSSTNARSMAARAPRSPAQASSPTGRPATGPQKTVAGAGDVVAPMSASVIRITVKVGEAVAEGQTLVVLEAMKMETNVPAPSSGKVTNIHVEPGEFVREGQPLLRLG